VGIKYSNLRFWKADASLTYSITNDVYLENIDQPGVFHLYKHGWLGAFVLFNSTTLIQRILPPGSVTISNNIFANSLTTNHNGFAVAIMGGAGFPMPAPTKFFNNIVYMWNYGPGGMAGLHSPIWDQFQHRHDQYQHWAHPKN